MAVESIPFILPRINDKYLEFKRYLNWLLVLMDRRINAEVVTALPFEITIDLSTVCQLSCPYCSVGSNTITRDKDVLRPATHNQILQDLSDSLFIIWYFSTGEPLLNRFLPEIIASTQGKEIYSIISTNLSLKLSDERIDKLLLCGLGCISVSIDGASAQTYSRYRVGGDFDLVIHNVQRLVTRKRELGLSFPHIEWRFLVFRHNIHEVPVARVMAAEMGVDLLEFFYGYAPPEAADHEVQRAEWQELTTPGTSGPALDCAINLKPTTIITALDSRKDTHTPVPAILASDLGKKCDWLYFGSTLFPNGSVGPCCLSNQEPDDFGTLSESKSFKDIWNNTLYKEARTLWTKNNWDKTERICSRCPETRAQDYQFRMTLQALLRNAPDWVLKILVAHPEQFFFDTDHKLSPHEFNALLDCDHLLNEDFHQEQRWLADIIRRDKKDNNTKRLKWIRKTLMSKGDGSTFSGIATISVPINRAIASFNRLFWG